MEKRISTLEGLPDIPFEEALLDLTITDIIQVCNASKTLRHRCNLIQNRLWRLKYQQLYSKTRINPDIPWLDNIKNMDVFGFGIIERHLHLRNIDISSGYRSTPIGRSVFTIPSSIQLRNKAIQVSAGTGQSSLILDETGTVWASGENYKGKLGLGRIIIQGILTQVVIPKKVTKVVLGNLHSAVLDVNGQVWLTGSNQFGETSNLPHRVINRFMVSPFTRINPVRDVTVGYEFTVVITTNGVVWGRGRNIDGQLGLGDITSTTQFQIIPIEPFIVQCSAGRNYTLFLDNTGDVWATGLNTVGQLGIKGERVIRSPVEIPLPEGVKITKIFTGNQQSALLDLNGNVWVFGQNMFSQLGLGSRFYRQNIHTPTKIQNIPTITHVSMSDSHTALLDTQHRIWVSGANQHRQITIPGQPIVSVPTQIKGFGAVDISCGSEFTLFIGQEI